MVPWINNFQSPYKRLETTFNSTSNREKDLEDISKLEDALEQQHTSPRNEASWWRSLSPSNLLQQELVLFQPQHQVGPSSMPTMRSLNHITVRHVTLISNYKKQMNVIVSRHLESKIKGPRRQFKDLVLPKINRTVKSAKARARGENLNLLNVVCSLEFLNTWGFPNNVASKRDASRSNPSPP